MKGVVLSGGRGTRLRPITHTGPKQLVPIANKPVLQYVIEDMREAGITEIAVVLGNTGSDAVQAFLGDGSEFGVDITYVFQGAPLGLSHAVGCARDFVGDDDFVVYLGDNILDQSLANVVERFEAGDYAAGLLLREVDNPEQFGVATLDESGDVVRVVEKPAQPETNLVLTGIFLFSSAVFDAIERVEPSERGELEITDAFQHLIDDGRPIASFRAEGWWKDTGKPEDILEANRFVLEELEGELDGHVEDGAEVVGHVDLAETATIESGAVLRGPVSIAAGTVVGHGTYVGPYTSIGPDSEVRRVHIENTILVGETTITADETIVDSLIGAGTSIGSADDLRPKGYRLVIGENSNLKL
ncbi:glucose-1-phosphate thymidylyltransferase [Halapricum desulfuricans]|nr:glucose-1-phosphate thymidylyltransferase [Halapricum desulfuricans]